MVRCFSRNEYKTILIDSLHFCQKEKGMEIFACCIMTNHVHLVFRSVNELKPELLLGDFKRFTRRAILKAIEDNPRESRKEWLLEQFRKATQKSTNTSNYQFWRHNNKLIELWSNKVVFEKIIYVHNNPVEEGIVFRAEEYLYSSARDYVGIKGNVDNIIIVR